MTAKQPIPATVKQHAPQPRQKESSGEAVTPERFALNLSKLGHWLSQHGQIVFVGLGLWDRACPSYFEYPNCIFNHIFSMH